MEKYDVIIIGSGLGGLECGTILSKEGLKVCVLEKNPLFGGALQTYKRKGRKIDTGIHYLGSLEDGQFLNQNFRYLGIMDKLSLKKLDEELFDKIIFKNKPYHYAMRDEGFVEALAQDFPSEREGLRRYVDKLKRVCKSVSVDNLKKGYIVDGSFEKFGVSAAAVIEDCTKNETLRNVLASTSLLHSNIKEKSSFYEHAMVMYSYLEGAYRCVDGSMQIADELIRQIKSHGGEVLNNSEVTRILVKDEAIYGVEVNSSEILLADNVISNVHPKTTLSLVEENQSIKRIYRSRINTLENSYGIFTLNLLMKENHIDYLNHNVYIHQTDNVWFDKGYDIGKTSSCLITMNATSEENQQSADVISIMSPMYFSEVEKWANSKPEHRGAEYLDFKRSKQEELLELISRFGYDYSDGFDYAFSTTPLSYRDYIGTPGGSAFGIIKDFNNPLVCLIAPKTKLKGLLFTGQNINVHGALGVTVSSIYTCAELIGLEYLTKKIGNA